MIGSSIFTVAGWRNSSLTTAVVCRILQRHIADTRHHQKRAPKKGDATKASQSNGIDLRPHFRMVIPCAVACPNPTSNLSRGSNRGDHLTQNFSSFPKRSTFLRIQRRNSHGKRAHPPFASPHKQFLSRRRRMNQRAASIVRILLLHYETLVGKRIHNARHRRRTHLFSRRKISQRHRPRKHNHRQRRQPRRIQPACRVLAPQLAQ